ncbi:hypothetical protein E2C01_030427 [Portunus trituberculatus]|uniref:Uncharacterized protein n=1 Tax=Portunus trituberculatus TaxID=210409 RepID=A0A5B7EU80_PORTR|nr:hypothetical protein [Portunus trituberculatus]
MREAHTRHDPPTATCHSLIIDHCFSQHDRRLSSYAPRLYYESAPPPLCTPSAPSLTPRSAAICLSLADD